MEVSQTKQRMFADFSIDTLLRKEDVTRRPSRKLPWGIVQQANKHLSTTRVPACLGESCYSCSTPSCYTVTSCGVVTENTRATPQDNTVAEDMVELISVSDDNNDTEIDITMPSMDSEGDAGNNNDNPSENTFAWLACTRFKPPKLSRPRRQCSSRRYGRGPRIPFSTHQLAVLESTFVSSQYLSGDAIMKLAENLNLTETRVKIWFQNRRARFRREKNSPSFFSPKEHPQREFTDLPAKRRCTMVQETTNKQSFRHLINDLNLLVAGATIHPSDAKNTNSHHCS